MGYTDMTAEEIEFASNMIAKVAAAGSYYDEEAYGWVGSASPVANTAELASRFLRLMRDIQSGVAVIVFRENPDGCRVDDWPPSVQLGSIDEDHIPIRGGRAYVLVRIEGGWPENNEDADVD